MKCSVLVVLLCFVPVFGRPFPVSDSKRTSRQDFIGSWIQNSEWFPIEVNVPDSISAIGQGISNFGQTIQTGFMQWTDNFGNLIQGIPIINRITSHFTPRPYNKHMHIVIVPVKRNGGGVNFSSTGGGFNPYANVVSNFVPFYP